ncbi:hypothetical protein AUC68_06270 [Methyloceanibacter methanicus]|uniref:ABC transporter permease n=1 Tax=Methyloceanibacter methanicus TaxID=1774968 RepID=A0A1E3VZ22_9HYPH|nr:ABC transporter permease [Methyloceanibacter methanicus]ODR98804.1 hypothetical protein AUC68_06270 [Methyloceanibacter methanicus]
MLKRDNQFVLQTETEAPGFRVELRGTTFRLVATGAWTITEATVLDQELQRLKVPIPPSPDFTGEMDISGIAEIDTAGAWLLQRTAGAWQRGGLKTRYAGATDSFRILIEEVHRRGQAEKPDIDTVTPFKHFLETTKTSLAGIWRDTLALTSFLGEVSAASVRLIREPWRFRPVSFIHHLDHAGLRALPIIFLICFLIGAVVMQQGVVQLAYFGAEPMAVNMVAILSLREVGILLTSIMVAGRSGSAFTAEIGSMKMREEIDAMRTLGIDPMDTLVLPRVALGRRIAAAHLHGRHGRACRRRRHGLGHAGARPADLYRQAARDHQLSPFHGRHDQGAVRGRRHRAGRLSRGLRVAGSAESLGSHVTSAVVKAIFLVICIDGIFAMFLAGIGQ